MLGSGITLTSGNGPVVIDGSNQTWAVGGNQNQGMVELHHPYYRLKGIKVVNSKNTGVLLNADNLTVEGCDVSLAQRHGISTHTSRQTNYRGTPGTMIKNVRITNCTVHHCTLKGQGYGQAISLIADGFLVSSNVVHDNRVEGIDIWLGAKDGVVGDNVVYGNGATGIYLDGVSNVLVTRNRVFATQKGIGVASENVDYRSQHIMVDSNLVYDCAVNGIFVWDSATKPGYHGSQDVKILKNTLLNNKLSIYLAGDGNTGEVAWNVGYTEGKNLYSSATNSQFNVHDNFWLKG